MTTVNMSTPWEEPRCGTIRAGMKTNCLLAKADLGKARKTTFMQDDPDRVFGVTNSMDREGAREVTMIWREHQANPDAKPGPDFRAMNKMAAVSGLTSAKEQPAFRSANQLTLKTGEHHVRKGSAQSARNKSTVYGTSSSYRNAETIRAAGPDEPPLKHVIQGAYQMDWVWMNMARADSFKKKRSTFQATPTKASIGHTIGARQHMEIWSDQQPSQDEFKLTKFKKVAPRVTEYNGTLRKLCRSPAQVTADPPASGTSENETQEDTSAPEQC